MKYLIQALQSATIQTGFEKLRAPLSLLISVLAASALAGYILDIPSLYRPIEGGAATHPYTALTILLITLSIAWRSSTQSERRLHFIAALAAILVSADQLFARIVGTSLLTLFTPWENLIAQQSAEGAPIAIGLNTLIMLLFLATALLLEALDRPLGSQVLTFIAMFFPAMALTGYAYGLERFFGQMSILTTSIGLLLSLLVMSLRTDKGPVRALLSPHLGGRVARLQVAAGYIIPLLAGYLAIHILFQHQATIFGALVVLTTWLVILLASISAVIIERTDAKRLEEIARLQSEALLDPLTELSNRRHLQQISQHEINRAQRSNKGLWVLVLDLDHFKRINDTAGHDIGDKVLCAVADTLRRSVRGSDLVARSGGEEFTIILPDTNIHGAKLVGEKLRRAILATVVPGWTDTHGQVSASLGLSAWLGEVMIDEAIKRADRALYSAKYQGRNRLCVDPESDPACEAKRVSF